MTKIKIILTLCPRCKKITVYRGICQNKQCDYEDTAFLEFMEKHMNKEKIRGVHPDWVIDDDIEEV